jgi:ribosome biogenesis protein BMS1
VPALEDPGAAAPPFAGGGGAGGADGDFVAAAAFAGARAGFAFQAGPLGLGYYRDGSAAQRAGAPAAAAGAAGAAAAGEAEARSRCPMLVNRCRHRERRARALAPPAAWRPAWSAVSQLPAPECRCGTRAASMALARALPLMGYARGAQAGGGWLGMRTVAQLRRAAGVGAPRQPDSLYRPVERRPRRFNPLKIPSALQARATPLPRPAPHAPGCPGLAPPAVRQASPRLPPSAPRPRGRCGHCQAVCMRRAAAAVAPWDGLRR